MKEKEEENGEEREMLRVLIPGPRGLEHSIEGSSQIHFDKVNFNNTTEETSASNQRCRCGDVG